MHTHYPLSMPRGHVATPTLPSLVPCRVLARPSATARPAAKRTIVSDDDEDDDDEAPRPSKQQQQQERKKAAVQASQGKSPSAVRYR